MCFELWPPTTWSFSTCLKSHVTNMHTQSIYISMHDCYTTVILYYNYFNENCQVGVKTTYVTGPAKIDHLNAKNHQFSLLLLYHNLKTVNITATKTSSLLQNLVVFLLQLTKSGFYILNGRNYQKYNSV